MGSSHSLHALSQPAGAASLQPERRPTVRKESEPNVLEDERRKDSPLYLTKRLAAHLEPFHHARAHHQSAGSRGGHAPKRSSWASLAGSTKCLGGGGNEDAKRASCGNSSTFGLKQHLVKSLSPLRPFRRHQHQHANNNNWATASNKKQQQHHQLIDLAQTKDLGQLIEQSDVFIHPKSQIEEHEQFWRSCIQAKSERRLISGSTSSGATDTAPGPQRGQSNRSSSFSKSTSPSRDSSSSCSRADSLDSLSPRSPAEAEVASSRAGAAGQQTNGDGHQSTGTGSRQPDNNKKLYQISITTASIDQKNNKLTLKSPARILVASASNQNLNQSGTSSPLKNANLNSDYQEHEQNGHTPSLTLASECSSRAHNEPGGSSDVTCDLSLENGGLKISVQQPPPDQADPISTLDAQTTTTTTVIPIQSSRNTVERSLSSKRRSFLTNHHQPLMNGDGPSGEDSFETPTPTSIQLSLLNEHEPQTSMASSAPDQNQSSVELANPTRSPVAGRPLESAGVAHLSPAAASEPGQLNAPSSAGGLAKKSIFEGASKDEILEYLEDARERVPEVLMAADEVMVLNETELIVVNQLDPEAPATPISIVEPDCESPLEVMASGRVIGREACSNEMHQGAMGADNLDSARSSLENSEGCGEATSEQLSAFLHERERERRHEELQLLSCKPGGVASETEQMMMMLTKNITSNQAGSGGAGEPLIPSLDPFGYSNDETLITSFMYKHNNNNENSKSGELDLDDASADRKPADAPVGGPIINTKDKMATTKEGPLSLLGEDATARFELLLTNGGAKQRMAVVGNNKRNNSISSSSNSGSGSGSPTSSSGSESQSSSSTSGNSSGSSTILYSSSSSSATTTTSCAKVLGSLSAPKPDVGGAAPALRMLLGAQVHDDELAHQELKLLGGADPSSHCIDDLSLTSQSPLSPVSADSIDPDPAESQSLAVTQSESSSVGDEGKFALFVESNDATNGRAYVTAACTVGLNPNEQPGPPTHLASADSSDNDKNNHIAVGAGAAVKVGPPASIDNSVRPGSCSGAVNPELHRTADGSCAGSGPQLEARPDLQASGITTNSNPNNNDIDNCNVSSQLQQQQQQQMKQQARHSSAQYNNYARNLNLSHGHVSTMNRLNYYLMSRQQQKQHLKQHQTNANGNNKFQFVTQLQATGRVASAGTGSQASGGDSFNQNQNQHVSSRLTVEFQCPDCDQFLDCSTDEAGSSRHLSPSERFRMERIFDLLEGFQHTNELASTTPEELDRAYIAAMNGLPLCKVCEKKRCERKEIIAEFVETELKYGGDLKIIHDEFQRPMQIAGLLNKDQINGIFLNLEELIMANTRFSARLQTALQEAQANGDIDFNTVCIGQLFTDSAEMLHSFESYCVRQSSAACLLARLAKEKDLLRIFLRVSQMENSLLRRMNLAAFLMVPVQRVTRYPLLLNRLYKVTAYHHKDRESLRDAQLRVELHLEHINRQTKEGGATNKIWRRLSNLSAPNSNSHHHYHHANSTNGNINTNQRDTIINKQRALLINTDDIDWIKLRKTALDILQWDRDETQFIHSGKLYFTPINEFLVKQRMKSLRYMTTNALLIVLGKPNWKYRPDLIKANLDNRLMSPTPGGNGIKETVLLLFREKNGRFILSHEPLFLSNCILSNDCSQFNSENPLSASNSLHPSQTQNATNQTKAANAAQSNPHHLDQVFSSTNINQTNNTNNNSHHLTSKPSHHQAHQNNHNTTVIHNSTSSSNDSGTSTPNVATPTSLVSTGTFRSGSSLETTSNSANTNDSSNQSSLSYELDSPAPAKSVSPTSDSGAANNCGFSRAPPAPSSGPQRTGSAGSCGTGRRSSPHRQHDGAARVGGERRTNSYNEGSSKNQAHPCQASLTHASFNSATSNNPHPMTPPPPQAMATNTNANQPPNTSTNNNLNNINYSHHLHFHNHHQPYGAYEESFELHERLTKESLLIRADTPLRTRYWLQMLRYHAKDLGHWRQRRNAFANIMMMRQERT